MQIKWEAKLANLNWPFLMALGEVSQSTTVSHCPSKVFFEKKSVHWSDVILICYKWMEWVCMENSVWSVDRFYGAPHCWAGNHLNQRKHSRKNTEILYLHCHEVGFSPYFYCHVLFPSAKGDIENKLRFAFRCFFLHNLSCIFFWVACLSLFFFLFYF